MNLKTVRRKGDSEMLWHLGNFSMKVVSKILVEEHAENVTEVVCWNILKFKYTTLTHTNTQPTCTRVPIQKRHKSESKK
jgi:hypothetical protein